MKVYRVTRLVAGSYLVEANSYAEVAASIVADDNVCSIEELGDLLSLEEHAARSSTNYDYSTRDGDPHV